MDTFKAVILCVILLTYLEYCLCTWSDKIKTTCDKWHDSHNEAQ